MRQSPVSRTLVLALLLAGIACSSPAAPPQAPASSPPAHAERTPAGVFGHEHWQWLEREGREEEERPDVVIRAMGIKDGDVVGEIGTGTGFFARRLARAVAPSGKVYANDIQAGMLDKLKELAGQEGITNIVPVLGTET